MNDDAEGQAIATRHPDADMLLYDYFKHLTSLSIFALGGILLITQNLAGEAVDKWKVFVVFGLVSLAGVMAFHGASEVVGAKTAGKAVGKSIYRLRSVAPLVLGAGVGVFLSVFTDALERL